MKRTRRSSATVLLALSLATASVAACGRADTGSSPSGAPATGSSLAAGKATGNLTVWAMGTEGELLGQLAKKFEADNPGTKITVTAIPWDSAHDKFTNAINASKTPDLAMVGTTWMGEFAGMDALDPTPASIDKSAFFSGAQKTTEVGGTSYGIPWYVETRTIFYRKDIAQKAGVTTEPTTLEGLKDMAKAMKDKGGAKWGMNFQPGKTGSWQQVLPFAWGNGASILDSSGKKFTLDTPEMTDAVKYWQSYFTDGLSNKAPVEGQLEADFVSGSVPMFFSGPWEMAAVEKLGGAGFKDKYGVFQVPGAKKSVSFVGGSNLAVFKSTQNRDAAWKFVQYLAKPETQVEWYKLSTDLPSAQAAWDDPALKSDAKLAVFGKQLESAEAPPAISTWEQVAAKFDTAMEQVAKQGLDPATALKQVESQASSIGTGGN